MTPARNSGEKPPPVLAAASARAPGRSWRAIWLVSVPVVTVGLGGCPPLKAPAAPAMPVPAEAMPAMALMIAAVAAITCRASFQSTRPFAALGLVRRRDKCVVGHYE